MLKGRHGKIKEEHAYLAVVVMNVNMIQANVADFHGLIIFLALHVIAWV